MIRAALIGRAERQTGEDAGWMRDVAALGRRAFYRLGGFFRFANHRGAAPVEMALLARLGAVMGEDCGPCTRIVARFAKQAGVNPAKLRAGLAGGEGLEDDADLAYRFGRAIATSGLDVDEVGEAIEAKHGRDIRTELTIAAATARVYPAIKRGLGYARSCSTTRLDDL
jgi:hypothetical protein